MAEHVYPRMKQIATDAVRATYLELDPANWYYFTYARNYMLAFSSEEDFNNAISETKSDKRKLKNEKGKQPYQFMLATKRKKDDFVKRFEDDEE